MPGASNGSDASIYKAIADGDDALGMEAFRAKLAPDQLRAMVIYIRAHEMRAARAGNPPPRPQTEKTTHTKRQAYRVEIVIENGLRSP
ncbi:MAG: hypothetical protein O3B24_07110 [Verrucomicrobia bacterium]|nr:hypothetical protein [Verrucomicrobiota bacterium]